MLDVAPPRRGRGRVQSTAPSLTPVDAALPEPVERQVYRSIRQGLMSGRIAPGATLTSRPLALELKVSVQPVRDALKRLEADGVLNGRPQSGFYLRDLSGREYSEIIEIRQRLEGLAGRLAAAVITPEMVDALRRTNERMSAMVEPHFYLAENYHFHFAIYTLARRPALLSMIENLWVRIGPALHHYPTHFDLSGTALKHEAIIVALAARDADATEAAIAHDLDSAAELVVPQLPAGDGASVGDEELFRIRSDLFHREPRPAATSPGG